MNQDSPTSEQEASGADVSRAASENVSWAAHRAQEFGREAAEHYVREPATDIFGLLRDYAREKPDVAAMWCFALGVIVGWKLKP